jgi:hypothetical protein
VDQSVWELCDDLLARRLKKMFTENLRTKVRSQDGRKYVQIPVIDRWVLIEQAAAYEPEACRATLVQMNFEFEKPLGWPRLPTSAEAIEKMKKEPNWPATLVGYYAASRAGVSWRPHPCWDDWVAGVADIVPRTPKEVDVVVEAGLKVRPRPLVGLNRETLCWEGSGTAIDDQIDAIYAQVRGVTLDGPLYVPPKS